MRWISGLKHQQKGISLSSHFTSYITVQLQFHTLLLDFHQLVQFIQEADCTCSHATEEQEPDVFCHITRSFMEERRKRNYTGGI